MHDIPIHAFIIQFGGVSVVCRPKGGIPRERNNARLHRWALTKKCLRVNKEAWNVMHVFCSEKKGDVFGANGTRH